MGGLAADGTMVTAGLCTAAAIAAATWIVLRARSPERSMRAARKALDQGHHATALAIARRHRPLLNAAPRPWHDEQRQIETEVLHASAEVALRSRRYAEALDTFRAIAILLRLDESDASHRVVDSMLSEIRRLSASNSDDPVLPELVSELFKQQPNCPEAAFWLAIHHLRRDDTPTAIECLRAAAGSLGNQCEPHLYLGAIWLLRGSPRDALRALSEANRIAPNCPLISWQLGTALTESGGDSLLALRALQKATGPDGLPRFLRHSQKLWVETLPHDSWIRSVILRPQGHDTHFRCPIGLDRVTDSLRQARLALAGALVNCQRAREAVPIYEELFHSDQSAIVRRGLGFALAQLDRHDDAVPHLRHAYAQENPPSANTTGMLAMSLSLSKGDRRANVRQALKLINSLDVEPDAMGARQMGVVFAAALQAGVSISPDKIAKLCMVLIATSAADPDSASVYDLFAKLAPNEIPREVAWLYSRAAQVDGVCLSHDEDLLDRTMRDRRAAREFYQRHEWDFDAVERLYLQRWALRHPGTYPTAPGPSYAAEAEASLLNEIRRHSAQGRHQIARELAFLAIKLNPLSGAAYDSLAELAYRFGDRLEASNWLHEWQEKLPNDPRPLARLGLLEAANNDFEIAFELLKRALARVQGSARVPYLLLCAKLAIASKHRSEAKAHFEELLSLVPSHQTALLGRAALAWAEGDIPRLVSMSSRMATVPAEDPWFHYLTGAALLFAGNLQAAELSAKLTAADDASVAEGRHLLALIRARRHDIAGAVKLLGDATMAGSVAAQHAAAMLGQLAWQGGDYAEALRHWLSLPSERLETWNLASTIGAAAYLAGIQAWRAKQPENTARWLTSALRHGQVDPRIEKLLAMACANADGPTGSSAKGIALLAQAVEEIGFRPTIVLRLAHLYRRNNQAAKAHELLNHMPSDAEEFELERGLLALGKGNLVAAERAFVAARNHDPQCAASCLNLVFTRLSLGRLSDTFEILPRAIERAPTPGLRRLLEHVHVLAGGSKAQSSDWTGDDDEAIVQLLRSFGRLDSIEPLFSRLAQIRAHSSVVQKARAELTPLIALSRLNLGDPASARVILDAHPELHEMPIVRNLLGVAVALLQEFGVALRHFQAALPPQGDDARLQQNLAIVRNWLDDAERSEAHWRRFLSCFREQTPAPAGFRNYHKRIQAIVRELALEPTSSNVNGRKT